MVLVVDDDAEWTSSLASCLNDKFDIECAADGEAGLRMARLLKPAAILLDVMMPGGRDGLTIFCELRKDPDTWHIPVVVLSSINKSSGLGLNVEDMRRYLGCVPEALLEKPANIASLMQELQRLVDLKGSAHGGCTRSCDPVVRASVSRGQPPVS
jgi:CheY-like chemotaxis protein